MKKILSIIVFGLTPVVLFGQQFPFMEGYVVNQYSMSPGYSGLKDLKTLFMDYRSDWTGMNGGPVTYQLTYNDRAGAKVGLAGKFVYDRTDIFKQVLFMTTYAYDVNISKEHYINFSLSAGLYHNSVDFSKYYNDPTYVQDLVLLYGTDRARVKFATDMSALYRYRDLEAGLLFSNIMFGTARYKNSSMTYKPLKNYQIHASYLFTLDDKWSLKPILLLRGGQNVPPQFEVANAIIWSRRLWFTMVYRTGGVFGGSFGGEIYKGFILNYSYNLSSNVAMNTFGSHQISLGVRIAKNRNQINK